MRRHVRSVWPFRVAGSFDDTEYVVRADLPGLRVEDIKLTVTGRWLKIAAVRVEADRTGPRLEFRYGPLRRTVMLPSEADPSRTRATYRSGRLIVRIPLAEPASATKSIPISA
jgi:HSP20 family protein